MLHVFLEYDVGEFGVTSRQHQLRSQGVFLTLFFSLSLVPEGIKETYEHVMVKFFLLQTLAQEIKLLVYDLWEIKE